MTTTSDRITGAMRATVLAAESGSKGKFRALVSAYDVKYRIGYATWHTIEMGAFAASIAEQTAIPIYQMHSWSWSELPGIGHGVPSESADDGGLIVDGELYVDDSEMARVVWRQMLAKAMREWSIGYAVLASRRDPNDEMHEIVTEGELLEASSVLRGANPDTKTLQVASLTDGRTRITSPSGVVVETSDPDLIARLTAAQPPAAPTDPEPPAPTAETHSATNDIARSVLRPVFGS